jgi:hypothetical protein
MCKSTFFKCVQHAIKYRTVFSVKHYKNVRIRTRLCVWNCENFVCKKHVIVTDIEHCSVHV